MSSALPQVTHAFVSPIDPSSYPRFAFTLTTLGLFFMAWFFVYQLTTNPAATTGRRKKNLGKELLLSFAASIFLGFGTLFVLLASGVYV